MGAQLKKAFFIHIGFNKTGTTSIQAMMHQNTKLLLEHGIYYPSLYANHGRFLHSMFMDSPHKKDANIREGYGTYHKACKLNKKFLSLLENELSNPAISKVIFSGEALSTLSPQGLKRFSQWLDQHANKITILCCTRHPVSWFNSQIQEGLKRRTRDINAICNALSANQAGSASQRLKNYANCFGQENIIVYDFDKHKHRLYEKFLESCEIGRSLANRLLQKPIKIQNESLSQEAGLLLDQLNHLRPLAAGAPSNHDESSYFAKIKGHKFKLPPQLLSKVLRHNDESSKWLAENFKDECANYISDNSSLASNKQDAAFSRDITLESLALLISDLIDENEQLIHAPLLTVKTSIKHTLRKILTRCRYLRKK